MTNLPFSLKGQTTGTIRASSTFSEKNPTTTLHLLPPPTITLLHPSPSPSSPATTSHTRTSFASKIISISVALRSKLVKFK
ncbi:hypothetical protein Hanom_Chr12g01166771 [Helianthus anomalus]